MNYVVCDANESESPQHSAVALPARSLRFKSRFHRQRTPRRRSSGIRYSAGITNSVITIANRMPERSEVGAIGESRCGRPLTAAGLYVTFWSHMNAIQKSTRNVAGDHVDDRIWSALGDSSRRQILDLLRGSAMTTGQLALHFDSTRFAVMKHLKVLHDAGLIVIERRGRERVNHLNPLPIQAICRRWIQPFEKLPADRLLRIKQLAELRPKA